MAELKDASRRVAEAARALGLDIEIRDMPQSTRTAEEAAAACGCAVGQIVKSLVFAGADTGQPILVLVSGANRVDEAKAAGEVGEALRRPDAKFVREVTGFAIGGVPPLGHANRIAVVFDRDLLAFETVWAAAGTPNAVFAVNPARLAEAVGARVVSVK
jgi:prolyl-tRNA editing enzyme YbaK/EbsC (Cys-tRNA(Pro) deacylase)